MGGRAPLLSSGEGPVTRSRVMTAQYSSVADERRMILERAAKERFGITNDVTRIGYILQDGTTLNMSRDSQMNPGQYLVFHEGIGDIYDDPMRSSYGISLSAPHVTQSFLKDTHAVRVHASPFLQDNKNPRVDVVNIEAYTVPTPAQWEAIRRIYCDSKRIPLEREDSRGKSTRDIALAYDLSIPSEAGKPAAVVSEFVEHSKDRDVADLQERVHNLAEARS